MRVLLLLLSVPLKAGTIFSCGNPNKIVPVVAATQNLVQEKTEQKKLTVVPPLNMGALRKERIKRHIKVVNVKVNIQTELQPNPKKKRLRKRVSKVV